jgi:hypothetical protein
MEWPSVFHHTNYCPFRFSTEREHSGAPRPPSGEEGHHSLHTHPRACDGLHPLSAPDRVWRSYLKHRSHSQHYGTTRMLRAQRHLAPYPGVSFTVFRGEPWDRHSASQPSQEAVVSHAKTLRHWERVGLLPKAARTHTGYRIFGADANHYIEFILKARVPGQD